MIYFIILLVYLFQSIIFVTGNEDDDISEALCVVLCYTEHRQCDVHTNLCGVCLEGYTEENNKCSKEADQIQASTDEKKVDDVIDSSKAQQHAHKTPTHADAASKQTKNNVAHVKLKNLETDKQISYVKKAAVIVALRDTVSQNSTGSRPVSASLQNTGLVAHPAETQPDNDALYIMLGVVAACSVAALVGIIMAGVCWYKLQKNVKAASEVEYPAYGIQGPHPEKVASPGDRKLAHSAQMYHYQHQKQQMIALEKANGDHKEAGSDVDSDDENEEGDYTVYECPGLAPTGEMEVKNPLFGDDTPLTPNTAANMRSNSKLIQ